MIDKRLLQNLRVMRLKAHMDTLTFKKKFIDDVDLMIDTFDGISKKCLFDKPFEKMNPKTFDETRTISDWFKISVQSISEWIVSVFEIRICHAYVD